MILCNHLTMCFIPYFLVSLLIPTFVLSAEKWTGKWFPEDPSHPTSTTSMGNPMGVSTDFCDNAKDNLEIDFDPTNITHSVVYMCLSDWQMFKPNYTIEPIIKEYTVPPAYRAPHKCMNSSIEYEERIPTFGTHRPLWPKYGEYKYVPPQRWVHNLEHGGVVMLYHPCANYNQIEKLKLLVKNCLYRHVITPSSRLTADRPLVLVAWSRSLEMSVVDEETVIKFIKTNALRGPEKISRDGQYEELLLNAAKILSDSDDTILCPNNF